VVRSAEVVARSVEVATQGAEAVAPARGVTVWPSAWTGAGTRPLARRRRTGGGTKSKACAGVATRLCAPRLWIILLMVNALVVDTGFLL
jgi:hypothetical protein